MSEAIGLRPGQVRSGDLRALYGRRVLEMASVDVVVVADGGTPVTARLALTTILCGTSLRCAIVCPTCSCPKGVLLARKGSLQCAQCHRLRTRRQMERHRADWNRRGAKEEDALLRVIFRARRPTAASLGEARRLARLLLDGDRARLAHLQAELSCLQAKVEGAP